MHQYQINRLWLRRSAVAAIALGCALGTVGSASAQISTPPPTSTAIAPPAGSIAFTQGHALGTQGYICLPAPAGSPTVAAWNTTARPEATLFQQFFGQQFQVITHFLSPNTHPNKFAPDPLPFGNATWQSSFDSSKVWAQAVKSVKAGTDDSCPNADSIACLLLQAIGTQDGPAGGKILSKTTFVQRVNTKGGLAPADGCAAAEDIGKQALVPYSADYFFWTGPPTF